MLHSPCFSQHSYSDLARISHFFFNFSSDIAAKHDALFVSHFFAIHNNPDFATGLNSKGSDNAVKAISDSFQIFQAVDISLSNFPSRTRASAGKSVSTITQVAATAARSTDVVVLEDKGLQWYTSSNSTRRGFCNQCGSSLFWEPAGGEHTSIMAGTLDGATGLTTTAHICVETAGDYYRIGDGVPQVEGDEHGVAIPEAPTSDQQ